MNISLRPWTPDDAELYAQMMRQVDFTYEDESVRCANGDEALQRLRRQIQCEHSDGDFYRAITVDGDVVGHIQIVHQQGEPRSIGHVGCLLVRRATGHGVGTEALRQTIRAAFARPAFERLTAIIFGPNRASQRIVEKAGFILETTIHHAVWKKGHFYDALVYYLTNPQPTD